MYRLKTNIIGDDQREIIKIAFPVFIELLLGSLFGMVNMMMIGKFPDSQYATAAVAAVGLTNQPLWLILAFVQALNIGSTALISRYHGAKEHHLIQNVLKHVLLMNVFCCIIPLAFTGFVFAEHIFALLGAQPETIQVGAPYFRLMMISFLFQGFMMSLSAALRGVGETKIPMRNNITANVVNVLLNSLLIYGLFGLPRLGLVGSAIATICANMLSAILMFSYLLRGKSIIRFKLADKFHFDKYTVKQLVQIGLPSAGEQLVFRAGAMIFTVIVSDLGTAIYAAHQIGLNIWSLSIGASQALGIAIATLVGRELGAKRLDMAQKYARIVRYLALIVGLSMAALFFFFGETIAHGYSDSATVIQRIVLIMPFLAMIQPFMADQAVMAGSLRGAGDTMWPMFAVLIGVFFVRTILAYIFVTIMQLGLIGAWYALLGNQIVSWIIILLRFNTGKWRYINI